MYFSDDGDVLGIRYDNWKIVFMEQRCPGTLAVWAEPFVPLRLPKIFNLRTDPYERADITSNTYWDWVIEERLHGVSGAGHRRAIHGDFREFPPSQKAATFTLNDALEKMSSAATGGGSGKTS